MGLTKLKTLYYNITKFVKWKITMADMSSALSGKGFLKKAFSSAVSMFKELSIHSFIHFTIAGGLIAAGYADFISPVLEPLGNGIIAGLDWVGLGDMFNSSALVNQTPSLAAASMPSPATDVDLPVFGQ